MKKNLKTIIALIILLAAVILFGVVYFVFGPKPVQGSKSITIHVTDDKQTVTVYEINTDAEYLSQAMEEAEGLTFSGTESEYGMMVDTINGVVADYNTNGAYWSFTVNGQYSNYGIDTQPIMDGDEFGITYTPANEIN